MVTPMVGTQTGTARGFTHLRQIGDDSGKDVTHGEITDGDADLSY
jgi:hypothetical protein